MFPGTYVQWNILGDGAWVAAALLAYVGGADPVHARADWAMVKKELGPFPDRFVDFDIWSAPGFENLRVRDDFSRVTHWNMVLLGTKGAGMFNHWDIMQASSWQVGRHRWSSLSCP